MALVRVAVDDGDARTPAVGSAEEGRLASHAALAIGPESDDYPRLCLTSA